MNLYDILKKHLPKEMPKNGDGVEYFLTDKKSQSEIRCICIAHNQVLSDVKQALQKVEVDEGEMIKIAERVPCNIHMLHKHRQDIAHAIASNMDKIIKEK